MSQSQNIILLLIYFQPFKNVKTILSWKVTQKQTEDWIWYGACVASHCYGVPYSLQ